MVWPMTVKLSPEAAVTESVRGCTELWSIRSELMMLTAAPLSISAGTLLVGVIMCIRTCGLISVSINEMLAMAFMMYCAVSEAMGAPPVIGRRGPCSLAVVGRMGKP